MLGQSAAVDGAAKRPLVTGDEGRFLGRLARFFDDGNGALLADKRIGQNERQSAVLSGQRVLHWPLGQRSPLLVLVTLIDPLEISILIIPSSPCKTLLALG